jgi:hypothetical protein
VVTALTKLDPRHLATLERLLAESLAIHEWTTVVEGLALLRPELPARIHRLLRSLTVPNSG